MFKIVCILIIFLLSSNAFGSIKITDQEAMDIGMKIWRNESANSVELLVAWNEGEDFASLGIGHFIWYPPKRHTHFVDSFPDLIRYMKQSGIKLPYWLQKGDVPDCPWPNRAAFLKAHNSKKVKELRDLMIQTIPIQAKFIANKAETTLLRILKKTPANEHPTLTKNFYQLAKTPKGIYILADYINFKGEGLGTHVHYNNQGWGLLQVLRLMNYAPRHYKPEEAFVWSANHLLIRRVQNAPRHRDESRWLPGWKKRLLTYLERVNN